MKSGKLPNFGYQLQLASGRLEEAIRSKEQIKQFLNGMYGGRTPNGQPGFSVTSGVNLEALSQLSPTKLVSQDMLDQYAEQYARNGLHGTCTLQLCSESSIRQGLMYGSKLVPQSRAES